MKRTLKPAKLALKRENVRLLSNETLTKVNGGTVFTVTCTVTCPTMITCWSLCECPSINNRCWPPIIEVNQD